LFSEQELEQKYGVELMARLAQKLELLRTTGTARESFIGTFDPSTQKAEYLYGVKPNGELLWYRHRIVTRKIGVVSPPRTGDSPTAPAKKHNFPGGNNDPRIKLPDERGTFAKTEIIHSLEGPKRVGTGWESFADIIPAGLSGIYAVRRDGKLLWYRHDGFLDGSMNWTGYREIGRGWADFKQIVPMGDGIIYAITQNGNLEWRRHVGYLDGRGLETPGAWEGPKVLGRGWGDFKFVFAGGEGIIYAVTNNGDLRWYRNKNFMAGVNEWEGPNIVGNGWESFKMIFSTGEGMIYAMKPSGELVCYKHDGYSDGTKRWQAPVQIAADWSDFIFVFPRMKGTYVPPVVR
jgi:outer membrane protein assembly factor BamB